LKLAVGLYSYLYGLGFLSSIIPTRPSFPPAFVLRDLERDLLLPLLGDLPPLFAELF